MYYPAASIHDIELGKILPVNVRGVNIIISNVDGIYYAMENECTHDGASFGSEAHLEYEEITCPRHGAVFDVTTGEPLSPPASSPVATFPARVNGETIEVDIDV